MTKRPRSSKTRLHWPDCRKLVSDEANCCHLETELAFLETILKIQIQTNIQIQKQAQVQIQIQVRSQLYIQVKVQVQLKL